VGRRPTPSSEWFLKGPHLISPFTQWAACSPHLLLSDSYNTYTRVKVVSPFEVWSKGGLALCMSKGFCLDFRFVSLGHGQFHCKGSMDLGHLALDRRDKVHPLCVVNWIFGQGLRAGQTWAKVQYQVLTHHWRDHPCLFPPASSQWICTGFLAVKLSVSKEKKIGNPTKVMRAYVYGVFLASDRLFLSGIKQSRQYHGSTTTCPGTTTSISFQPKESRD